MLYASTKLEGLKGANFDQTIGIQIVQKALRIPCKTIVDNSGFEGSIVVEKLLKRRTLSMDTMLSTTSSRT